MVTKIQWINSIRYTGKKLKLSIQNYISNKATLLKIQDKGFTLLPQREEQEPILSLLKQLKIQPFMK